MNYQPTEIRNDTVHVAGDEFATVESEGAVRSSRKWIVVAVLVVAALVAAWYFFGSGSGEATPAGDRDDQAPRISVISPGRGTIEGTISATGSLSARRRVEVGVEGEGGRVVSVGPDQGEWVRAGQTLVSINRTVQNQQAQAQRAQIAVARADAELAQGNLDRALQLVERGFVSRADVDRLTATRDAARARVQVAQAQLGELEARTARLNITAPVSGLVLQRNVEPGQVVSAGSGSLFVIARGGEMELLAQVGEADLARLSPGVQATVVPAGTEKRFTGQIWQLAPTIDEGTRQGTARVALAYAPELRPGGFATATISSGTIVAPILPESAVLSDDDAAYVYVVGEGNKVERRAVQTGAVTASGVVIARGLTGGERVVLRAGGFLNPGEVVTPVLRRN